MKKNNPFTLLSLYLKTAILCCCIAVIIGVGWMFYAFVSKPLVLQDVIKSEPTPTTNSLNKEESPMRDNIRPQRYNINKTMINKLDDIGNQGAVHSRIGHNGFSIEGRTSGVSPDVFQFIFDHRAEIVGIWVSIDYSSYISLFEFEARINAENTGYGNRSPNDKDALIHTSHVCYKGDPCDGDTDEHIWFGINSGIEVNRGDWIAFGAWMNNKAQVPEPVHPEFIVWYRWLE